MAAFACRKNVVASAAVWMSFACIGVVREGTRIDVDPTVYPVQALRFLAQNSIGGRVALPFEWGEVALWSLPGGSTVAIDGRFTTAYPQEVLDEAWR